jgi:hypothetical protein
VVDWTWWWSTQVLCQCSGLQLAGCNSRPRPCRSMLPMNHYTQNLQHHCTECLEHIDDFFMTLSDAVQQQYKAKIRPSGVSIWMSKTILCSPLVIQIFSLSPLSNQPAFCPLVKLKRLNFANLTCLTFCRIAGSFSFPF